MKLYVIPTDQACNAECFFCITDFRDGSGKQFLEPKGLESVLDRFRNIDSIEITGGGEPVLNKDIEEIIDIASRIAPTKMYTNAELLSRVDEKILMLLDRVCISRAHHDDEINHSIMGVRYDINAIADRWFPHKLKLSLLLNKRGISTRDGLMDYISWASSIGIDDVVVRELIPPGDRRYYPVYSENAVKIRDIVEPFEYELIRNGHKGFVYNGVDVEFDADSCSRKDMSLILKADGNLYTGWDTPQYLTEETLIPKLLERTAETSTCLGYHVAALIMNQDNVLGMGSNSGSPCLERKYCNRVVSGHEEDYSYCLATHAEENAIAGCNNKEMLDGSTLYLKGHHTICEDCIDLMRSYGLEKAVIIDTAREVRL